MRRIAPAAVAFTVLAALVAWKEIGSGNASLVRTTDVALSAPDLTVSAVRTVEIRAPGSTEPVCVLEKQGDRWLAVKPFRAPASVGAIEKLVKALSSADGEVRSEDPAQFASFDLSPERASTIRVLGEGGKVLAHVAVGRSTLRQGCFVRLLERGDGSGSDGKPDDRALATTKDLRAAIGLRASDPSPTAPPEKPTATHFHDTHFPTVDLGGTKRIDVRAPGRSVTFESGASGWTCVAGGPSPGSPLPVNEDGLGQMLRVAGPELRTSGLADPTDLGKLGLADPRWTVTFTLADGTERRLFGSLDTSDAGNPTGYVRLDAKQDPDVVYTCTSWEWQRLFPAGSGLFRFEPVAVDDGKLRTIVVDRSGADAPAPRIVITRPGTKPQDDWVVAEPAWPLTPRAGDLRSLASLLRNVRATDWSDTDDLGEEKAVVRWGNADTDIAKLDAIRIGGASASGKDRVVTLPGQSRVHVLADSTVDRLVPDPLSIFDPKPFTGWTYDDVTAVRYAPAGGAPWTLRREDVRWTLVHGAAESEASGTPAPANSDAVRPWIEDVLLVSVTKALPAGATPPAVTGTLTFERREGKPVTLALTTSAGSAAVLADRALLQLDRATLAADATKFAKE